MCDDLKMGKGVSVPSTGTLQERVEQLLEFSSRRPIIKFNNKLFKVRSITFTYIKFPGEAIDNRI